MKRVFCLLLVLTLVLAVPVRAAAEVFEIRTVEDLLEFAQRVGTDHDLDARLMADLDLTGLEWDPVGGYWYNGVDQRYSGEFDGNGHCIRNMTIRRVTSYRYLGFFEALGVGGYVHDLTLEDIDIAVDPQRYGGVNAGATTHVGGLAGYSDGVIENCHVSGRIYGVDVFQAGGMIGDMGYEDGIGIWDCTTDVEQNYEITEAGASTAGYAQVGGIAGSSTGVIDNCHAFGDITLNGCLRSCGHTVGGVVAFSGYGDALVRNCSNSGDISADVYAAEDVEPDKASYGGVCASYSGDEPMVNCFNTGSIRVTCDGEKVLSGGIVGDYEPGYSYRVHYDNCWSSGSVRVTDINGLWTDGGFREDDSSRNYFIGNGAGIGSPRGRTMEPAVLSDGSLTRLLNRNRDAFGDNGLLPWVQTAEGPRLLGTQVRKNPFTDVPFDAFYLDSVIWAVEEGITTGTSSTTFSPGADCQRAAVVTFLWRVEGCPEPKTAGNPFRDIEPKDFYYKAVLWAVEEGITNGTGPDTFSPMGVCNRAQVVTFLYRAMGSPEVNGSTTPFRDVKPGQWYTAPVLWAVEQGVTNGMGDGTFGADSPCNRAQIVTFLYRAYTN